MMVVYRDNGDWPCFFGGVLYFQRDPYIDTSHHIFRHTMYMHRNLEKIVDPETGYDPLMVSQMGISRGCHGSNQIWRVSPWFPADLLHQPIETKPLDSLKSSKPGIVLMPNPLCFRSFESWVCAHVCFFLMGVWSPSWLWSLEPRAGKRVC